MTGKILRIITISEEIKIRNHEKGRKRKKMREKSGHSMTASEKENYFFDSAAPSYTVLSIKNHPSEKSPDL